MKYLAAAVLSCAACAGNAQAQNDVYVCTDENGAKEYKNTGATKGCRKVDLPGLSVAPQPKRAAQSGTAASAGAATTPVNFPKVDAGTQKSRDSDRKLLLQQELNTEEKKLAGLKADFNNGEPERRGDERNYAKYQERVAGMKDDIARSERNIAALKRELANVR
ncbi:hypothetical protein PMI16_04327 [Herbaspirillum sp. CF444]|uniref:DUF4124 domain-containing protein n=1 Tax=Herbaspirillum sp. CF444 TaxID=1144319 RepID=UPI0002725243|nr:DUF4124 domain-containing protein [Herbaspirillum sp. CF444]EJL83284.1 hypothetical protein PMI16_04327 [Herbaspirillum sp. CF444]